MKKKPTVSKLKKKLEDLAKAIVKIRDDHSCQRCGKYVTGSDCHGSHVIPVSAGNQYRFDLMNIKVLCYHCHLNFWHKNPIEATEWFKNKFPDRYQYLFGQPRKSVKFSASDLQEMISQYQEKLKTFN